jgi:ubiquinone/menaquinone biosynthesis C-methylase UbiE
MMRRLKTKELSQIMAEWDALAPLRYEQITSGIDISYNRVIAPALFELLKNADLSNVLDAGCGTGAFASRLSDLAARITAIDPSEKSIEIARRLRLSRTTFIQATAEDYSREHRSVFNTIVANMVLMDVLSLDNFLAACSRMLVPNGMLAFSITHPCFWPEYYGYSSEPWFKYETETIIESPFRISADRIGSLLSTHVHRPLSMYLNAFTQHGFLVKAIIEPVPPSDVDDSYRAAWNFPRYIAGLLQSAEQSNR